MTVMKSLSLHEAARLPLHDADFIALEIKPQDDGGVTVMIKLKVHPDEKEGLSKITGTEELDISLIFQDCLLASNSISGICSGQETIDDFTLIENSELLNEINSTWKRSYRCFHFHFDGSHGSKIDILTNSVAVGLR